MSLNTALSGLLGAQQGLNVAANDLANASTTGFKSGSARFSDIYTGGSANATGQGVAAQFTEQNFSEGNLQTTGNPLDLAIQGTGFFVVQKSGLTGYTRDGAFQLSQNGQLQNAAGSAVMGYGVNGNGSSDGILAPITVATSGQPAKATSNVSLNTALNSADPVITAAFNPATPSTYDQSTSVVAYDSLGNANHIQLYYVKNPASGSAGTTVPNTWSVYAQPQSASGAAVGSATHLTTLAFNSSGALTSGGTATLNVNWNNGAANSSILFNLAGTTVGAQGFAVNSTTNNGRAPGTYTGTSITKAGQVQSLYSNGQTKTVGLLALASFVNNQGLTPVSGNLYRNSPNSGQAVLNLAGAGVNGTLRAGSLEQSNVQTSNELVDLLRYQQAYQSNASVIQGQEQDFAKLEQVG